MSNEENYPGLSPAPYTEEIARGETVILRLNEAIPFNGKVTHVIQGTFVRETPTAIWLQVWDADIHQQMLVQYFKNQNSINSLMKAANHHM